MDRRICVAYNRLCGVKYRRRSSSFLLSSLLLKMLLAHLMRRGRRHQPIILGLNYHEFFSYPILSITTLYFPTTHTIIIHPPTAMNACYTQKGSQVPTTQTGPENTPPIPAKHRRDTRMPNYKCSYQEERKAAARNIISFGCDDYRWLAFMIKSSRVYWPVYSKESPKTPLSRAMQV